MASPRTRNREYERSSRKLCLPAMELNEIEARRSELMGIERGERAVGEVLGGVAWGHHVQLIPPTVCKAVGREAHIPSDAKPTVLRGASLLGREVARLARHEFCTMCVGLQENNRTLNRRPRVSIDNPS